MKRIVTRVGLVLAALFVLVTLVGLLLPRRIVVERTVSVQAQPGDIYPLIANLKRGWPEWNPFQDPAMVMAYSGAEEGVGASQSWESPKAGDGRMTVVKADPARGVEYELWLMHDSFRMAGALVCAPAGGKGTELTWTGEMRYGWNPYRRYFGLVAKSLIGKEFEKGLGTIKSKAEAKAAAAAHD